MKRLYINIIFLAAAISVWATTIDVTPGRLRYKLIPSATTELVLRGSIDASDLYYLADKFPGIATLDLSGCPIESYSGAVLKGSNSYPADAIPQGAFAGTAIRAIIFPAGRPVTICDGAFTASQITQLSLPAEGARIGVGAFAACQALAAIDASETATIAPYAFHGCTSLTSATLIGVDTVGDYAFAGCSRLGKVTFSSSLATVGKAAFEACDLDAVDLGGTSVRTIGDWAFARNANMVEVKLPATLCRLGDGAFADCYALQSFAAPASVRVLANYILKDSGLTTVALAATDTIGAFSLKGVGAEAITLPQSLKYIGDNAMEGMTSLRRVDAKTLGNVPVLGKDVWAGVDQSAVDLIAQAAVAEELKLSAQWQEFNIVTAVSSTTEVSAAGTVRVRRDGSNLRFESTGAAIAAVTLYGIDGLEIVRTGGDGQKCTVDMPERTPGVVIAHVVLVDGNEATIKIQF